MTKPKYLQRAEKLYTEVVHLVADQEGANKHQDMSLENGMSRLLQLTEQQRDQLTPAELASAALISVIYVGKDQKLAKQQKESVQRLIFSADAAKLEQGIAGQLSFLSFHAERFTELACAEFNSWAARHSVMANAGLLKSATRNAR